jgi:hypothetical protein
MERSTKSLRRVLEVSANLGIVIVALIIIGNFVASKWRTKREIDNKYGYKNVYVSGCNSQVCLLIASTVMASQIMPVELSSTGNAQVNQSLTRVVS